jgi:hypothetical protein
MTKSQIQQDPVFKTLADLSLTDRFSAILSLKEDLEKRLQVRVDIKNYAELRAASTDSAVLSITDYAGRDLVAVFTPQEPKEEVEK